MSNYTNNVGKIYTTRDISLCENNAGEIETPANTRITRILNNAGVIKLGKDCVVAEIKNNAGKILVQAGSRIDLVSANAGIIELLGEVMIGRTENSSGQITRRYPRTPTPPRNEEAVIPTSSSIPVPDPVANPSPSPSSSSDSAPEEDAAMSSREHSPIPLPEDARGGRNACKICLQNEIDVAFSCGHLSCRPCSGSIIRCHICREVVTQRTRLFFG